jgi:hypothetical protein
MALAVFSDSEMRALCGRVRSAPEPEVCFPDGETF